MEGAQALLEPPPACEGHVVGDHLVDPGPLAHQRDVVVSDQPCHAASLRPRQSDPAVVHRPVDKPMRRREGRHVPSPTAPRARRRPAQPSDWRPACSPRLAPPPRSPPWSPGSRRRPTSRSATRWPSATEPPEVTPPLDYLDASNFRGFPEVLENARLGLRVVNASCPGETTASLIDATAQSNGCENSLGSPVGYRTAFPLHRTTSATSSTTACGSCATIHGRGW